jgi:hypothetical protein
MTVGLALGGGAAFGLSHIGVFKVLEDNGIPIDLLAGSSMGSIVALGYAAGIRADRMLELARTNGTKLKTLSALLDVTLTRPGFLAGDRLVAIFAPMAEPSRRSTSWCSRAGRSRPTSDRRARHDRHGPDRRRLPRERGRADAVAPLELDGRCSSTAASSIGSRRRRPRDGRRRLLRGERRPRLKKTQTVLARSTGYQSATYLASGRRDLPNMFDVIMNSMQTLQYELGTSRPSPRTSASTPTSPRTPGSSSTARRR